MLVALCACVVSWSGKYLQGQVVGGIVQPGKDKDKKGDKKEERPPEDENIPFGFQYDRDSKKQLEAAREYLGFKEIPWPTVCPLLQRILEAKSDSFFNVPYMVGAERHFLRISVKTEANRIIAAFPKEGLQFYQQTYGQTASVALDDAIRAGYDIPMLADLSQKYFHTKAGAEATILLGTVYLERGNYLEAAYAFERILSRPGSEEVLTPRTLFKACLAFRRSGDERHQALYKTTLPTLQSATPMNGLAIGRKTYSFEQLKAELERPLDLIRVSSTVGEWAMKDGNPSRTATVEGGPPFLDPIFRSTMFHAGDDDANSWIKHELEKLFARDNKVKGVPLPAFFPITTSDMVLFRDYSGLHAVATRDQVVNGRVVRAGELLWRSKDFVGIHQLMMSPNHELKEADLKDRVKRWWGTYTQTGVTSVLYENPLLGSISHDDQSAYFVDDLAIPQPPQYSHPEMGMPAQPEFYSPAGELANAIRAGRLSAVDLRTGRINWDLGRVNIPEPYSDNAAPPPPTPLTEEEADRTTDAYRLCVDAIFLSAPLPLNGKLYVLIEQGGVIRLLCLDPRNLVAVPGQTRKPTLLWSQKLGQPNNPLPKDSVRRYQGTTLAAGEGILICPTNSGAVVAVDIMSRSLLWAHAYRFEKSDMHVTRPTFGPDGRPILPIQLPEGRWRAGGPHISNGRVILTAYDSNKLECLDLRTGKVLWKTNREANDLYVGGIVNDRVVVVGKNQVRGYHLSGEDAAKQEPRLAFGPVNIPTPTGHGVGGKGIYYVPVRQDNAGTGSIPPAEIWAINVENGQLVSKTAARKRNDTSELMARYGLGNLVFQDGLVISQSAWEVACYPQLDQKKAEMDRLLKGNPRDPVGLLARGELYLDDGKLAEAIADFHEAEKNNLPEEKRPLLREKKYVAYTELIRADFTAGEKYLGEYKALCELPAPTDEGAEEKVMREDEMNRRQRLFQYLLARGREGQGRLGEAFDHYIALAGMGEAKTLQEMPDEPNVRMRPDVWARGRIESMIRRAADPAARKSLEDRVQKEWDVVKGGNDLKRLREFVAVFGSYFTAGAEAQFLLADKLLETNNEADAREAQTFLGQLRATADDPTVRARATEALARLMIKNQLMEDAVGLYLQLGKEYPNVKVRDGKTGSDFLVDLLTDKRLLPFLEPSRYPMPTRVKAEQKEAAPARNLGAQFEIEPSGDLFPMYRRYRFVIDQFMSGNGTWTVCAYDRATGAQRCSFGGLTPPNIYNAGTVPFSKFVQANGQLLLVQLGPWIYCFDLAEKKERWQRNLIGDAALGINQPNPQITDAGQDGEIVVRYADGYTITLGKAAVLQPGYAALLTRDGLEVVEPLTRRVLWTRKGIQDRTQLYGDSRYLVLVETGSDRRPVSTKVLRAIDGMPVEGSPDSGRVLAMAKWFQIMGRTALILEGSGDQPRSLRLHDLATGKDIWKKAYGAKAIPIKSLGNEWTGFIKPNGEAEVIETRTGRVVATLRIDEKKLETDLKPCQEAQLFADADRFYLFLDRDPSLPSTNGTRRQPVFNNSLRSHKINGPLYAFDRTTGKRLWEYGDGLFENQMLILEQFAELPVIMVAGPVQNANGQLTYPVVIIEKARGKLIFDRSVLYNNAFFHNLQVSPKNGTIELNRQDLRIHISADESGKSG